MEIDIIDYNVGKLKELMTFIKKEIKYQEDWIDLLHNLKENCLNLESYKEYEDMIKNYDLKKKISNEILKHYKQLIIFFINNLAIID